MVWSPYKYPCVVWSSIWVIMTTPRSVCLVWSDLLYSLVPVFALLLLGCIQVLSYVRFFNSWKFFFLYLFLWWWRHYHNEFSSDILLIFFFIIQCFLEQFPREVWLPLSWKQVLDFQYMYKGSYLTYWRNPPRFKFVTL